VRRKSRGKSSGAANTTERASSRFNSRYFGEIVAKLDDRKKKIIQDHDFGILLEYDGCSAPRGFVQWIADQVDLNCCDIVVGGKVIPFSAEAVHLFLGLPIGGDDIREKHNDSMKNKFFSEINETSLPLIKTFGEKLLGDSLSDDDVFRFFMVVALSTFLCANSSTLPSPQYLGALIDVSKVKEWDWSKFVFDWLFASISNYRKKNRSTIGGCRYFLAAYYLDFVNFGKRHELPPSLPRILCWKGSMIKIFASYDHVSGDKYGKRPVKCIEDTCYAEASLPADACDSFRSSLDKHCNFIHKKHKDNMCQLFKEHHSRLGYRSPGTLVAKMFKYLYESYRDRDAADPSFEAENSSHRVSSRAHDNVVDEGVGAVPAEVESPLHSPAHGIVPEVVLDEEMDVVKEVDAAGCIDGIVKDVPPKISSPAMIPEVVPKDVLDQKMDAVKEADVAGCIDDIVKDVHSKIPSPTVIHEDEASVTEKIESDGLYDVFGSDYCADSQSTEILPSNNSSAHVVDSGRRKRKRKHNASSQTSSHDSVASRTRHGLSQRLGKSPLSCIKASVLDHNGIGGTKENPVVIEEAPIVISNDASKHENLELKVSLCVFLIPFFYFSPLSMNQCMLF